MESQTGRRAKDASTDTNEHNFCTIEEEKPYQRGWKKKVKTRRNRIIKDKGSGFYEEVWLWPSNATMCQIRQELKMFPLDLSMSSHQ